MVKCSSIDILNIIKDSGYGTVDAAKVLFKSLEDKCFKKFELIDARYKLESLDLIKMKKNVESFMPKLDKVNRDIEQIKEIGDQQKEEIFNNKQESNNQNNKIIKLCEEKNDDISKKLIQLKEEIDKNINKNMKEIEEKLKIIASKKDDGASSLFKFGLVGNSGVDEEKIQVLDKKINDIRTKTNDLENSFKIFLNEELEVLKNDVKELKFKIDKKIAKEDLKELYNLHLSDVDEINDLKDRIGLISDDSKKMYKDVQNIGSKIESLNGNMLLLQNSQISGGRGPIIDFTKYIDQQKLTDTLKPIIKEIEKIYKELESFQREMNEMENNVKLLEKKERVNQNWKKRYIIK
jgi:DNA repair exonuclease SbcCD ATPase subunit